MTTVAVGGDAFARHLAEHRASALGNPVTEAHKITNVRYVPGARSSGWNTAPKCFAVGGRRLDADPHRAGRDLFLHAR
ncbi:MAG: hypothetical protein WAN44_22395 [Propionibacteriaceae bacterium]